MSSGHLCQCPAIKGTKVCCNHTEHRKRRHHLERVRRLKQARSGRDPLADLNAELFDSLQLPVFEDAADIAVVLSNTTHLLGGGHISARKAEAIISACRIAGVNLRNQGNGDRKPRRPTGTRP